MDFLRDRVNDYRGECALYGDFVLFIGMVRNVMEEEQIRSKDIKS